MQVQGWDVIISMEAGGMESVLCSRGVAIAPSEQRLSLRSQQRRPPERYLGAGRACPADPRAVCAERERGGDGRVPPRGRPPEGGRRRRSQTAGRGREGPGTWTPSGRPAQDSTAAPAQPGAPQRGVTGSKCFL